MITYRLLQTRRHVYELLEGHETVAAITLRGETRAAVVTGGGNFDLETIEDVRRRVVRTAEHPSTVARASSLGRYAVDLEQATLYWQALPGPARSCCWMTADGSIAIRYRPEREGTFTIECHADALPKEDRERAVILGAYLLLRIPLHPAPPEGHFWDPSPLPLPAEH
ncbi:MAG TPA: hypothetical protein VKH35_10205 [Thermoanaerobaculia bacterium]|nr:hypothetical protein [Thermoanaerobaculia bacterium]